MIKVAFPTLWVLNKVIPVYISCISVVHVGHWEACSAHAQWATMMWADTSHVVSVVTILSNGTSKVPFPLRHLLDRCNSTQLSFKRDHYGDADVSVIMDFFLAIIVHGGRFGLFL